MDWLAYAHVLRGAGRPEHAAQAYRRALEIDPFSTAALGGLASSLAETGDADALFAHLDTLVLADARLALQVLTRPAVARFSGDPRYAGLLTEARSQAVD